MKTQALSKISCSVNSKHAALEETAYRRTKSRKSYGPVLSLVCVFLFQSKGRRSKGTKRTGEREGKNSSMEGRQPALQSTDEDHCSHQTQRAAVAGCQHSLRRHGCSLRIPLAHLSRLSWRERVQKACRCMLQAIGMCPTINTQAHARTTQIGSGS